MRKNRTFRAVVCVSLFASVRLIAQDQPFLIEVSAPGSYAGELDFFDMSPDGTWAAGNWISYKPFGAQAFRWSLATGLVGVASVPGGESYRHSLAAANTGTFISDPNFAIAFWSADHTIQLIDAPWHLCDASADGSVLVGSDGRPYRWTASTGVVRIGEFSVERISSDGSVIVGYRVVNGVSEAVRWTEQDGLVSSGIPNSYAAALSADGSIIAVTTYDGDVWLWTAAGLEQIDDDGLSWRVCAMSGDGGILGGGDLIWFRDTREFEGISQLTYRDYGFDPGWSFWEIVAISDDGRTIAGTGLPPGETPTAAAWIFYRGADCGLPGDLDRNGVVNVSDLATMLANFRTTYDALPFRGDTNGDQRIDLIDLGTLLGNYGVACP